MSAPDGKKLIASCSFGKDSLAAIIAAEEHGLHIDEAVYCRIMFDEKISAELPEHEEFIHTKAIPLLRERYGIKTTIVQAAETYCSRFFTVYKDRSKKKGEIYGFPMRQGAWCNSHLKVRPINKWQKAAGEYTAVVGIAAIKEPAAGYGPDSTGRRRGNSTSFRGGGAYTHDRAKNNSATVERESHGLTPNESGKRNRRSVWTIATRPYKGAHFATFPEELVRPCILAGSRPGDTVLDPFAGSGTTGAVATQEGRDFIGIEINPDYCEIIRQRLDACCQKGAKP